MKYKEQKSGISLLVLILIIIILIIIAGAVILAINNNDIYDNSQIIITKNDLITLKESVEQKITFAKAKREDVSKYDHFFGIEIPDEYKEILDLKNGVLYVKEEYLEQYGEIASSVGVTNTINLNGKNEVKLEKCPSSVLLNYKIYGNYVDGNYVGNADSEGVCIPITVSGKNLFNMATLLDHGFTLLEDGSYYVEKSNIPYKKVIYTNNDNYEGRMSISYYYKYIKGSGDFGGTIMLYRYVEGANDYAPHTTYYRDYFTKVTFVSDLGKTNTDIIWWYGSGNTKSYIKNIQIEKGDEVTAYEPYVKPRTYNIYLDEPLKKTGDYTDYIDLSTEQVIRYDETGKATYEVIDIPDIELHKGTNIITVGTEVAPSKLSVTYYQD